MSPPRAPRARRRTGVSVSASRIDVANGVARVLQFGALVAFVVCLCASILDGSSETLGVVVDAYLYANILNYCYVLLHSRRAGTSVLVSFFFLFFVAIPAAYQISVGTFPWGSFYAAPQLVAGYSILVVAQLTYVLVELVMDSRSRVGRFGKERFSLDVETYWKSIPVLAGISLIVAVYLGSTLFLTRGDWASSSGEGIEQQFLHVGRSASLLGAVVCLYLLFHDRASRSAPLISLSLVMFGAFALLHYPSSLSRFQLLGSVLALASVILPFTSRWVKLLFGLASPVFLFFMFPLIKALGYGGRLDFADVLSRDLRDYLVRVDFDAFKQVVDAWIYFQNYPPRFGENFLGVFFFWVPRAVWSDKPISSGDVVSSSLGYSYNNVASPLPAEAYLSFGISGVILVFVMLALLVNGVERAQVVAKQSSRSLTSAAVLGALLMGFIVIILRGALNAVAPMFMSGFVMYVAIDLVSRSRHRARTRGRDGGHGLAIKSWQNGVDPPEMKRPS